MAGKESTDLSAGVKFERETEAHKERLAEVAEGTLLAQVIPPLPSCSHFLGHISPICSPFFPVFCAFSPPRRGGSNEPQAGPQGQETAGKGTKTRDLGPSFDAPDANQRIDRQVRWHSDYSSDLAFRTALEPQGPGTNNAGLR